ncbi:hypothetical protein F5B19DRAFT_491882, partial [Rostrohypoxylon terebratum]
MSGKVRKSSVRPNQRQERHTRADFITVHGFPVLLCSNCHILGESDCFLAVGYENCNHCVRWNRKHCDVSEMNALDRVSQARTRLEQERKDAEDELVRLQQEYQSKISEKIGKLQRLRRQEDLLKKRGLELLKQGDDLDAIEERERLAEEQAKVDQERSFLSPEMPSVVSPSSFSGIDFGLGPLSPSTAVALGVVDQDFGGESPQA